MASHTVLKEQLSEMGFEEALILKALDRLGEKATIESMINSIEELMSGDVDDKTVVEDNKNGVQTKDETNTEPTESVDTNVVIDDKERERKRLEYEERIKQRRIEREAKEKEEELKREIKRREDGKGLSKVKEELDQLQRKRVADEMKREKAEAKAAKDAILQQIARDREEQRRSRMPFGDQQPTVVSVPLPSTATTALATEGKCRLAIRLLDGKQLVNEFDSRETLSAVRVYVITQVGVDFDISFVMPPLPPFTEDDMQKPLNALGLCPSARVHVIKR